MISTSDIERDFLLGFIKIHVLHHAGDGPVYGTAIIEELSHHGYRVGPSLIYPLLHQLELQGYLSRTDQSVSGKVRKYYTLTLSGASALDDIKGKIAELVAEVIDPGTGVHSDPPVALSIEDTQEVVRALAAQIQALHAADPRPQLSRTLMAVSFIQSTLSSNFDDASAVRILVESLAALRQTANQFRTQIPGPNLDAVIRALEIAEEALQRH